MSAEGENKILDALSNGGGDQSVFLLPYTEQQAYNSAIRNISRMTEPEPRSMTEDPAGDEDAEEGGIVRRANEFMSRIGPVQLEAIALSGMEISKANGKRADELYRNKFPLLTPRFTRKCVDCGAEYDEEVDECEDCGGPVREPSQRQRTKAERFFQRVNKEGQSLRELYKFLARDGGRLGVWVHVVKKKYTYWDKPTVELAGRTVVERGAVYSHPIELVRADPKRLKPVVDANGRIGGWWWACPVHGDRTESLEKDPGVCEEHGVPLREVHFAEVESMHDDSPDKVYFEDEVVTHAPFIPRLMGNDGVSPVDNLWIKQAILDWMELYAAAFYDTEGEQRYPNKVVIVHTSNPDKFEQQLRKAKDDREADPYAEGILYNQVPAGGDGAVDKAQVLDMMSDELMGQSEQMRKELKSDIRSAYGLTDAQDSELSDSSGLNDEGLQLEINDRDKAATQQDLMEGPLRKLVDSLGYDDWEIRFVPPKREEEEMTPLDVVNAASKAEQSGIAYSIEDGRFGVADTDGVVEPEPEEEGEDGGGGGFDVLQGPHADDALGAMEQMQRRLTWGDDNVEHQARGEAYRKDDRVPEFVKEAVRTALRTGPVWLGEYEADNVTGGAVKQYLAEKLTQPQGWSRRSLAEDFADRFQISEDKARETLDMQVKSVMDQGREIGYRAQGDLDERVFKWVGPDDEDTTPHCQWLKEQTNPKYGGEPVTLDGMKELVQEAEERFGGDGPDVEWSPHFGCRHMTTEEVRA